jgi:uncharacterized membrane protein YidH (DUF202 family)
MTSRIRNFFKTPLFKNTGSTARDHLASERTFLAWTRTGLGFIALGIAIERFSQLDLAALVRELKAANNPTTSTGISKPSDTKDSIQSTSKHTAHEQLLVSTLLGTGMGSIVYGTMRYFTTLRVLEQGGFKPAFNGPAVLGIIVAGMASGNFWIMVRKEREKV